MALLKGMENILANATSSSSNDNLNSIIVIVTVINVNPKHLASLRDPVILRFKHLKVRHLQPHETPSQILNVPFGPLDHLPLKTFTFKILAQKYKRSFSRFGVRLWNEIPRRIRDLPKKEFKGENSPASPQYLVNGNDYVETPIIVQKIVLAN